MDLDVDSIDGTVKERSEDEAEVCVEKMHAEPKVKIKKMLQAALVEWEDEERSRSLSNYLVDLDI